VSTRLGYCGCSWSWRPLARARRRSRRSARLRPASVTRQICWRQPRITVVRELSRCSASRGSFHAWTLRYVVQCRSRELFLFSQRLFRDISPSLIGFKRADLLTHRSIVDAPLNEICLFLKEQIRYAPTKPQRYESVRFLFFPFLFVNVFLLMKRARLPFMRMKYLTDFDRLEMHIRENGPLPIDYVDSSQIVLIRVCWRIKGALAKPALFRTSHARTNTTCIRCVLISVPSIARFGSFLPHRVH